ncbi:hypothetical protein [Pseudoruegeria sp. SHC-113]|uniref:hypothetical protein n=1 Tax=Pseudoruegeria sp. SHC-113 TaxID=2855439 RepID=UPI0021BBAA52|nr:hypothetical protein [Pseudoruegeria sp. SHC-113]MCT8161686.1 hypothetical protein [Pseudoruegeria sp. SHC-113]
MDHNLFRKGEYDSRRNRFPEAVKQLAEENCRNSVTEILLNDAGVFYAVSNKNKSNSEQAFALVHGDIIYNGKVVNPWPQK